MLSTVSFTAEACVTVMSPKAMTASSPAPGTTPPDHEDGLSQSPLTSLAQVMVESNVRSSSQLTAGRKACRSTGNEVRTDRGRLGAWVPLLSGNCNPIKQGKINRFRCADRCPDRTGSFAKEGGAQQERPAAWHAQATMPAQILTSRAGAITISAAIIASGVFGRVPPSGLLGAFVW